MKTSLDLKGITLMLKKNKTKTPLAEKEQRTALHTSLGGI